MDNWLSLSMQILAGAVLMAIGYVAARIYENTKKVCVSADDWRLDFYLEEDSGRKIVSDYDKASFSVYSFTLQAFNTKSLSVGLHKIKLEFMQAGLLSKKTFLSHSMVYAEFYTGTAMKELSEITLPSGEWVVEKIRDHIRKDQFSQLAKCNAVYLTAETAEGKKKRWFLTKLSPPGDKTTS